MQSKGYVIEDQNLKHFAALNKNTRAPLINRGYYLRSRIIYETIKRFINQDTSNNKYIVSLGAGL